VADGDISRRVREEKLMNDREGKWAVDMEARGTFG
jgi:hypothetical protein